MTMANTDNRTAVLILLYAFIGAKTEAKRTMILETARALNII